MPLGVGNNLRLEVTLRCNTEDWNSPPDCTGCTVIIPGIPHPDKHIIRGGRLRWKIENEGFNVQKNGGYGLEHAYTRNATASKVFYYLLQVAHLIAQLIERGSLFHKAFPSGVGSAKNIALRLLEAWRIFRLSDQQLHHMLSVRVQIRFKPP